MTATQASADPLPGPPGSAGTDTLISADTGVDTGTAASQAAAPDRSPESLTARLVPPMPSRGWRGWVGPLGVAALGGALRFASLGQPHAIVFDETYYLKDALSLLRYGYERQALENANDTILASNGAWQNLDVFQDAASFVVHPPFGKWTIAAGEWAFGVTPFGWRVAVAVLGTLSILMVARILRRITRSDLIGTVAGLLLAVDGIHLVMSRTGLLDMVLSFWVLAAFGFLVLDRDMSRRRLAREVAAHGLAAFEQGWGPRLGPRPWRWAAGISLGLACGVKWSGLWFIAVFGVMTVLWDVGARRAAGVRHPYALTFLRSALPAFLAIVGLALVTYLLTWVGWFRTDGGWDRHWATGESWIPAALRSLWHYHAEAWNFHVGLTADHAYQSNPWGWLVQARPTSFFYESSTRGQQGCTADSCAAEVVALGNPVVWWAGALALLHQVWRWAARRDWRSGAVLAGILAGWAPWLLYQERTIFTFYSVVFVPFLVMALAMSLGTLLGPSTASPNRRMWGAVMAGGIVLAAVLAGWWFYPVWTGEVIPYDAWRLRMWMPTWV